MAAQSGSGVLRLGAFAVCLASLPVHAQEVDAKEFRALYAEATAKLADYSDHAGMVIRYCRKYTSSQPKKYKDRETASRYVYKAKGPLCLLETTESGPKSRGERVHLLTGHGVFCLEKSPQSAAYLMAYRSEDYSDRWSIIQGDARAPRAAFSSMSFPLVNLFTSRVMTINKCARRDNRYSVDYHYFGPRGHRIACQLLLDADNSMALLEHTSSYEGGGSKQTVRYRGEVNGVPLVERVDAVQHGSSGTATETWEVEKHLPGPFSDHEFTPATYGVAYRAGSDPTTPWIYLLPLFAGCVAASALARARPRRFPREGTPQP